MKELAKPYWDRIVNFDRLSDKDEKELSKMILFGSEEEKEWAIEVLTEGNLRLVVKLANAYRECNVDMEDIVSEGNIGLMTAARRFDYRKGVKFSTYAMWWIKQRMKLLLVNKGRIIRFPVAMNAKMRKIEREISSYKNVFGEEPYISELSEILGMKEREIEKVLKNKTEILYISEKVNDGDDDFYKFLGTTEDNDNLYEELSACIEELPEQQKTIIVLRFGLDTGEPRTLKEVADIIEKTCERVRQIQRIALKEIKRKMEEIM